MSISVLEGLLGSEKSIINRMNSTSRCPYVHLDVQFIMLGIRKGGGTYRAILVGGGGETYYKVPPPNPVLEASESGIRLVCARFL